METTKLSTKGQVILPKTVRDAHGWNPGTEFAVEEVPGGVTLRPLRPSPPPRLEDVAGCLRYTGRAKTLRQMEKAIAMGGKEATRFFQDWECCRVCGADLQVGAGPPGPALQADVDHSARRAAGLGSCPKLMSSRRQALCNTGRLQSSAAKAPDPANSARHCAASRSTRPVISMRPTTPRSPSSTQTAA